MESLGRQVVTANPDIYTDRVVGVIRGHIAKMMPNAPAEDKEHVYYRSVYDYWAYGVTIMEWFYYGFPYKSHEEKNSYLVARIRETDINHVNDKRKAAELLGNKYNTYKFLKNYYRRDMVLIHGEDDYANFSSFTDKHPTFVVKPVNFAIGLYIVKDSVANYASRRELFDKLLRERIRIANDTTRTSLLQISGEVDVILEEVIHQAPEMAAFHPASVNCIRVTTFKSGDDVKIFYPFLKTGHGGSLTDNAMAGGLFAAINISTGIIETDFFDELDHVKKPLERHPDTGVKIRGFQIPRWDEAVSLVKEFAKKLDGVNYVGWDLALTPEGWCVIEGNEYGDSLFYQIAYGRGMRREFEELIGWKLEKQFWWQ